MIAQYNLAHDQCHITSGYTPFYVQVDTIFSLSSAETCVLNEMSMQCNAELVSGRQLDLTQNFAVLISSDQPEHLVNNPTTDYFVTLCHCLLAHSDRLTVHTIVSY